jgi:pimeloyl-ACP methyl ester carboxylesterase
MLLLLALCTAIPAQEELLSLTLKIAPQKGFQWPYYLYLPAQRANPGRILVQFHNMGKSDDDPQVHIRDAYDTSLGRRRLAERLGCPVLVPAFPRPKTEWRLYTHALDRDTLLTQDPRLQSLDLQVLAMLDDARQRLRERGWETDERVLLFGFSADGMFSNRFTFLHPERVRAAAIGSPGGWPLAPVAQERGVTLRYPIGSADLTEVAGRPLQLDALRKVDFFFFLGDKDTNDSVPYRDGYDEQDQELIDRLFGKTPVERWPQAEKLYRGLNATFKLYPGVDHVPSEAMDRDVIEFLRRRVSD